MQKITRPNILHHDDEAIHIMIGDNELRWYISIFANQTEKIWKLIVDSPPYTKTANYQWNHSKISISLPIDVNEIIDKYFAGQKRFISNNRRLKICSNWNTEYNGKSFRGSDHVNRLFMNHRYLHLKKRELPARYILCVLKNIMHINLLNIVFQYTN